MPTLELPANQGSITNTHLNAVEKLYSLVFKYQYDCWTVVAQVKQPSNLQAASLRPSRRAGLSCSRSPFRNQWTVCFLGRCCWDDNELLLPLPPPPPPPPLPLLWDFCDCRWDRLCWSCCCCLVIPTVGKVIGSSDLIWVIFRLFEIFALFTFFAIWKTHFEFRNKKYH